MLQYRAWTPIWPSRAARRNSFNLLRGTRFQVLLGLPGHFEVPAEVGEGFQNLQGRVGVLVVPLGAFRLQVRVADVGVSAGGHEDPPFPLRRHRGRGGLRAAGYRGGDFDLQGARRVRHADFLRDGPELRQLLDRYFDRLAARLDPQRQVTHRRSDGDRHVHGPAHLAVSPHVERRGLQRHGLDFRLGHLGFGITDQGHGIVLDPGIVDAAQDDLVRSLAKHRRGNGDLDLVRLARLGIAQRLVASARRQAELAGSAAERDGVGRGQQAVRVRQFDAQREHSLGFGGQFEADRKQMRPAAGPGVERAGLDERPIAGGVALADFVHHRLGAEPVRPRRVIAGHGELSPRSVRFADLPDGHLGR